MSEAEILDLAEYRRRRCGCLLGWKTEYRDGERVRVRCPTCWGRRTDG